MRRYGSCVSKQREPKLPTGLSPSSIDLYHQCPKRFEEEKIKGVYSPPGIEAVLGTFVHRVLELLMQRDPSERTIEVAKECARQAWPETEDSYDFKRLKVSRGAAQQFRWDGWRSIENYFEMEPPHEVEVVATERRVKAIINEVPVRGIIDRLDRFGEDLVVSDYKNGKVTDKKYAGPKRDQLQIYAAMVESIDGVCPARARLIYTAHSEFMEVEVNEDTIGAVTEKVSSTWQAVNENFETGNWQAQPSPLCGWCPVAAKCPEGMAFMTMQHRKGRLKATAPGYSLIAGPQRR